MVSFWPFQTRTDRVKDVAAANISQAAIKLLQKDGRTPSAMRLLYRTLELDPANPQALLMLAENFRRAQSTPKPTNDEALAGLVIEFALDPKTPLPPASKPGFEQARSSIMTAWGFAMPHGKDVELDHIGYMQHISQQLSKFGGSVQKGFLSALAMVGVKAGVIDPKNGSHTRTYEEWLNSSSSTLRY